jgi:hypothetical protein
MEMSLLKSGWSLFPQKHQQKFASLFAMLADVGKLWNERKFKHLEGSDQIFEFKVDDGRILLFFLCGPKSDPDSWVCQEIGKNPQG